MQLLNMQVMWLMFKTAQCMIKMSEQQGYWWWCIRGTACKEMWMVVYGWKDPDANRDGKGQVHPPRVAGDCGRAGNILLLSPVSHISVLCPKVNNNNLKIVSIG